MTKAEHTQPESNKAVLCWLRPPGKAVVLPPSSHHVRTSRLFSRHCSVLHNFKAEINLETETN